MSSILRSVVFWVVCALKQFFLLKKDVSLHLWSCSELSHFHDFLPPPAIALIKKHELVVGRMNWTESLWVGNHFGNTEPIYLGFSSVSLWTKDSGYFTRWSWAQMRRNNYTDQPLTPMGTPETCEPIWWFPRQQRLHLTGSLPPGDGTYACLRDVCPKDALSC